MATKQVEIQAGDTLQLTVKDSTRTKSSDTYINSNSVPGKQYHVYLYTDGTGACDCKAYYERGVAVDNKRYVCSHIRTAQDRALYSPSIQVWARRNPYDSARPYAAGQY